MKWIQWIEQLCRIVRSYDSDLRSINTNVSKLEAVMRDRTDIAVDVGFRSHSHVIVVGRYKNRDYVQTFSIQGDNFAGLVDRLRDMERYGTVERIDAPPVFRAVFERERRL